MLCTLLVSVHDVQCKSTQVVHLSMSIQLLDDWILCSARVSVQVVHL
jgi:hypothetical protein